jgi:hypothetical protein
MLADGFTGYLLIDDFHHLPEDEQTRVARAIKKTADAVPPIAKIVVIGINRIGYPLLAGRPEITGRVLSISLCKQQPPSKIYELIEKGEKAANVRFQHKEIIVSASEGSFFIAQQICYHLCIKHEIMHTQVTSKDVQLEYNWVKTEFLELFGFTNRIVLNEFASIDHGNENRGAALVLLGLLRIEQDHYVLLDEAAKQYPQYASTIEWLDSEGILSERMTGPLICLGKAELQDFFYYDSKSRRIDIHDIQLIYYLKNMVWKEFARRAGYSSEIRGNRVRVRPLNPRRPKKPVPHLADMTVSSSKQPPTANRADVEQALPQVPLSGSAPDPADRLVDFLSKIPALSSPDNRSILLQGLPKAPSDTIARHSATRTDLHSIVQAALGMGHFRGRETLVIQKLLDNVIPFVQGLQLESELSSLRLLFTA